MSKQFNIIVVGGGIAGLATVSTNPLHARTTSLVELI